ncbi:tail virion protein G7P-2 [Providencia rettgeri]|nr:tail virion protein G7P-2 [Providencia rettgeri]
MSDLLQIYDLIFNVGIVVCFSLGFIAGGQR